MKSAVYVSPIPKAYLDTTNTLANNSDVKVPSQKAIKTYTDSRFGKSAGVTELPSFTDNGNGTANIGAGKAYLYSDVTGAGTLKEYSLEAIVASFTDGIVSYVVADYNSGSPVLRVITDVTLIKQTTIVPVYTVNRDGTELHELNWDTMGLAMVDKLCTRLVKTSRFALESGLVLSESATQVINISSGVIWYGATYIELGAIQSGTTGVIYFYSHSSGNWTKSTITAYNNTQYDNGTNLATLSANRYAVNWIYRGVEEDAHAYVVLGRGDYTLAEAEASQPPTVPDLITRHAVLVGRIIVKKSDTTATSVESAFDTAFTLSPSLTTPSDINLVPAPSSDLYASGVKVQLTATADMAFGDVGYIASTGKVGLIDADAIASMSGIVMCCDATIGANATGNFLLMGIARQDAWNWTVGGLIYGTVTGTSGNTLSQTAPTGTDDVVQIMGVATHADRMIFKPELVQIELV